MAQAPAKPAEGVEKTAGSKDASAAERREALEAVLPEAFAVVREAGRRALNMRHFDVQILGGIALHNGKIGDVVLRGAKIGEVGKTGRATGTHPHFEVRQRGAPVNPAQFLRLPG